MLPHHLKTLLLIFLDIITAPNSKQGQVARRCKGYSINEGPFADICFICQRLINFISSNKLLCKAGNKIFKWSPVLLLANVTGNCRVLSLIFVKIKKMSITSKISFKYIELSFLICLLSYAAAGIAIRYFTHYLDVFFEIIYYWSILSHTLIFLLIFWVIFKIIHSRNDFPKRKGYLYSLVYLIVFLTGVIYFFSNGFKTNPIL